MGDFVAHFGRFWHVFDTLFVLNGHVLAGVCPGCVSRALRLWVKLPSWWNCHIDMVHRGAEIICKSVVYDRFAGGLRQDWWAARWMERLAVQKRRGSRFVASHPCDRKESQGWGTLTSSAGQGCGTRRRDLTSQQAERWRVRSNLGVLSGCPEFFRINPPGTSG